MTHQFVRSDGKLSPLAESALLMALRDHMAVHTYQAIPVTCDMDDGQRQLMLKAVDHLRAHMPTISSTLDIEYGDLQQIEYELRRLYRVPRSA